MSASSRRDARSQPPGDLTAPLPLRSHGRLGISLLGSIVCHAALCALALRLIDAPATVIRNVFLVAGPSMTAADGALTGRPGSPAAVVTENVPRVPARPPAVLGRPSAPARQTGASRPATPANIQPAIDDLDEGGGHPPSIATPVPPEAEPPAIPPRMVEADSSPPAARTPALPSAPPAPTVARSESIPPVDKAPAPVSPATPLSDATISWNAAMSPKGRIESRPPVTVLKPVEALPLAPSTGPTVDSEGVTFPRPGSITEKRDVPSLPAPSRPGV